MKNVKITFDEAIEMVRSAFDAWKNEYDCGDDWSKEHEARDMAIEALRSMKNESSKH